MLAGIQQGVDLIVRPGLGSGTDMGCHGFRVIDRPLDKRRTSSAFGMNDTVFRSLYPSAAFNTDPFLRFVRVFKFALCHLFKIGNLGCCFNLECYVFVERPRFVVLGSSAIYPAIIYLVGGVGVAFDSSRCNVHSHVIMCIPERINIKVRRVL